jgi:hypothetical protein
MNGPQRRTSRSATWWRLLIPVVGLVLITVGVLWLESLQPHLDPSDRLVEDLPPLGMEDERSCRRGADDGRTAEIRDEVVGGARITSTQAYGCPRAFDGLRVSFAGEVVGELLPRRGGVWAQVNDDDYALEVGPLVSHPEQRGFNTGMSVWIPDGLHEAIEGVGRHARRGSVVLVEGTFWQADPADAGGITLRADDLQILAPPLDIDVPLHQPQAIVAVVLAVLAVVTMTISRRLRRR